MKSLKQLVNETFISEAKMNKKKASNLLNMTDGLSGDWWLKGDMQSYNDIKNVVNALSFQFYSKGDIYDELDKMWYFDNTELVSKKNDKTIKDCKGMSNAEVLLLIMDEFDFDKFFPEIRNTLEKYANSDDSYYKSSKVWGEWRKLLK